MAFHFLWVTDFPLFEYDKEENRYVAKHHPFTCPAEEDLDKLLTDPGPVSYTHLDVYKRHVLTRAEAVIMPRRCAGIFLMLIVIPMIQVRLVLRSLPSNKENPLYLVWYGGFSPAYYY